MMNGMKGLNVSLILGLMMMNKHIHNSGKVVKDEFYFSEISKLEKIITCYEKNWKRTENLEKIYRELIRSHTCEKCGYSRRKNY